MSRFEPLVQAQPALRWVKGVPEYDLAIRTELLVAMLSKHLYGGVYQDFNVFYAWVYNDMANTIDSLSPSARAGFDMAGLKFKPNKRIGMEDVWSTPDEDYDPSVSGEFVPTIIGQREVTLDDLDWTDYLTESVIKTGGWVYKPGFPMVPFTAEEAAPYHWGVLKEAYEAKSPVAIKVVEALKIDLT